ncbi:MAG: amidohydrolase family protein [Halieaceae bacterium]|jgi:imidazolonepropionase-like amidohydrolase|nr:amidohydrolase family protein [Halieaceae bacterium]
MKLPIVLILSLFSISNAMAQTVYLRAAKMVDVISGEVHESPAIIIEDQRIVEVGSSTSLEVPADARVIDLEGMTIMPGLMDMHTHLTSKATEHGYKGLAVSTPREAITGVKNARTTLFAGVTTVRNVGAGGFTDVALRNAVNDGDVIGPRIFASGPALGITGGHCDNNLLPNKYHVVGEGIADGPWAVRQKVRENIKYGANVIKFCATGGVLSKGTKVGVQQYTQEEMDAIVDEAHRRGVIVAAHAHGTSGIKAAIKAGVDSIEHASFMDKEAIKLAKKHGTYLSMDIYDTEYILSEGAKAGMLPESIEKERMTGKRQRQSFTASWKAGVKMVLGTDSAVYPHGDNAKQLSRMVRFGMTSMEALQAATIEGAKLLKQTDNMGSLRRGRYADIIAVKGDPIANIKTLENVDFVMKGGVVYKEP